GRGGGPVKRVLVERPGEVDETLVLRCARGGACAQQKRGEKQHVSHVRDCRGGRTSTSAAVGRPRPTALQSERLSGAGPGGPPPADVDVRPPYPRSLTVITPNTSASVTAFARMMTMSWRSIPYTIHRNTPVAKRRR